MVALQATVVAMQATVVETQATVSRLEARQRNRSAHAPGDVIVALTAPMAPFALPPVLPPFPQSVAQLMALPALHVAAHLAFYALPAMPPVVGHGAAAAEASRIAGIVCLGAHLGLHMDTSWERELERGVARAYNASAHVAAHTLVPLRGPLLAPPAVFPATSGEFHDMTIVPIRTLCNFYGLPPVLPGNGELQARRTALARHIGLRE